MFTFAAVLLIFMSIFHSVLGERFVLGPINSSNTLPEMWGSKDATFRTIQTTWHLVSLLWLGLAVTLLAIQFHPMVSTQVFLIIFGGIFATLTVLPFIIKAGKHKTWVIFGTISLLLFWRAFNP